MAQSKSAQLNVRIDADVYSLFMSRYKGTSAGIIEDMIVSLLHKGDTVDLSDLKKQLDQKRKEYLDLQNRLLRYESEILALEKTIVSHESLVIEKIKSVQESEETTKRMLLESQIEYENLAVSERKELESLKSIYCDMKIANTETTLFEVFLLRKQELQKKKEKRKMNFEDDFKGRTTISTEGGYYDPDTGDEFDLNGELVKNETRHN
jgi:hypothetical protein